MDGHGKYTYYLIKTLIEEFELNPNNFLFCVIDIDPIVNNWHRLCFPNTFVIFDFDVIKLCDPDNHFDFLQNYVPYFNFAD